MIKLNLLKGSIPDEVSNNELRKNLSDANLFMQRRFHWAGTSITQIERQQMVRKNMKFFDKKL